MLKLMIADILAEERKEKKKKNDFQTAVRYDVTRVHVVSRAPNYYPDTTRSTRSRKDQDTPPSRPKKKKIIIIITLKRERKVPL